MDERAGVDPGRVDELWQRESARYAREHPRCLAAARTRARPHAPRRAHELDGQLLRAPAGVDRRRARRPLHLRRRAPLPRHQRRRQEHLLRHRPGAGRARRAAARGRRRPVHAAHGGCDRGRGGAGAPLAPPLLAVHAVRLAGQHRGPASGTARDRPAQGPHLHRQLRRARRRDADGVRRRGPALVPRAGAGRRPRHRRDPLQRRRRARARARRRRLRLRVHRTGADQRGRRAARTGIPRRPARAHARGRHAAAPRRDAHAHLRPRRPHRALGPAARRRRRRQGGRRGTAARRVRDDGRARRGLRARREPRR